jgi:hypothetical protein
MTTINPYQILGTQHRDGLQRLEDTLNPGMSFDQVNAIICDYVRSIYFTTGDSFIQNEVNSIIPNAANDYMNCSCNNGYNGIQTELINLLCKSIICKVPINSINEHIADVEDNISKSGLTTEEQIPLLMATAVGAANYDFWFSKIIAGGGNRWYDTNYFNSNAYVNYANLPYMVAASMLGTLSSANKAKSYGLIDPPRIVGVDMVSALTAGIGITAGVTMFKWIARIQSEAKGGFKLC